MHYALVCRPSVSKPLGLASGAEYDLVLLNDHSIFEHVTSDDVFMGVCGILECKPPKSRPTQSLIAYRR